MGGVYYAVGRMEIRIAESRSLKAKRSVLNHLKSRIASRFQCSVAEVEHQDLHQRGALGFALVVSGPSSGSNAMEAIRGEVEEDPRVVVLDFHTHIAALGDEEFDLDLSFGDER